MPTARSNLPPLSSVLSLLLLACGSSAGGSTNGTDVGTNDTNGAETSAGDGNGDADVGTKNDANEAGDSVVLDATDAPPSATIPQHFPTAAYAYQYNAFMTAPPEDVRYYLTIAVMPFSKRAVCNNTFTNGDCFSLMYMDTDRIFLSDTGSPAGCVAMEDGRQYGTLPETSFVHVGGTSITQSERLKGFYRTRKDAAGDDCPIVVYVGNDADGSAGGLIDVWRTWMTKNDDGALGGFFHDNMGAAKYEDIGYGPSGYMCPPFTGAHGAGTAKCSSYIEFSSVDDLDAAHKKFVQSITRPKTGKPIPELINGCPTPDGPTWYDIGPQLQRLNFATDPAVRNIVIGCESEGSLSSSSPARVNQISGVYAKNVAAVLNDVSRVSGSDFSYVMLAYGDPDPTLRLNERMFDLGVAWLAYQPGTRNVVQFNDFNWDLVDDEFFPEHFLVPWDALQSMHPYDETTKTHGEHDLVVAEFDLTDSLGRSTKHAALYCREFQKLYQGHRRTDAKAPTLLGHGAVCVNTSDAPRVIQSSYLKQTYAHAVTFPAHSIADPTAEVDMTKPFVAGTTTVGAGSAIFLAGP